MMKASLRLTSICGALALAIMAAAVPCAGKDLVDVVAEIEKSVVQVNTNAGFGSGVIVDDTGLVLTNFHVVEGARSASIKLRNGKSLKVHGFIVAEPTYDLALLRTDPLPSPATVKIAAQLPPVGTKVAAFGNPQGLSFSTSEGIVAAIRDGKELSTMLGEEEYRATGYALEATWIQTTAPISPGNSGGPLVNMDAELLGLNTFSHVDGQNLNFAIALPDIRRMLGRASKDEPPRPLEQLPTVRGRVLVPGWWKTEPFRLELPTGRVFVFETFRTDDNLINLAARKRGEAGDTVVMAHPNGALYAVAQQEGGVLHGVTLASYENKEPMVYAMYQKGRRHGILKTWDEGGDPVLFAQYLRGRRHGFACLFDDGNLAMICQFGGDQLEYVQLMDNLSALEGFDSQEAAEKDAKAAPLLKLLAETESTLIKNEADFRRQVRKYEMAQRRARAAQLGPEKRRRIQARADARSQANDAFIQEMYRRAQGR